MNGNQKNYTCDKQIFKIKIDIVPAFNRYLLVILNNN